MKKPIHEEMPIIDLDDTKTTRFEASRFLDSEETISHFLAASLESDDPNDFLRALAEAAKARGMNKLAEDSGLNRESLYKALREGAKPRYDTVFKLMHAMGVQVTVKPYSRPGLRAQQAESQAGKANS